MLGYDGAGLSWDAEREGDDLDSVPGDIDDGLLRTNMLPPPKHIHILCARLFSLLRTGTIAASCRHCALILALLCILRSDFTMLGLYLQNVLVFAKK